MKIFFHQQLMQNPGERWFLHMKMLQLDKFNQSEFAANLATVHDGRGSKEYSDPYAFFSKDLLTGGLKNLLKNAYEKIVLNKGDPIHSITSQFWWW